MAEQGSITVTKCTGYFTCKCITEESCQLWYCGYIDQYDQQSLDNDGTCCIKWSNK